MNRKKNNDVNRQSRIYCVCNYFPIKHVISHLRLRTISMRLPYLCFAKSNYSFEMLCLTFSFFFSTAFIWSWFLSVFFIQSQYFSTVYLQFRILMWDSFLNSRFIFEILMYNSFLSSTITFKFHLVKKRADLWVQVQY